MFSRSQIMHFLYFFQCAREKTCLKQNGAPCSQKHRNDGSWLKGNCSWEICPVVWCPSPRSLGTKGERSPSPNSHDDVKKSPWSQQFQEKNNQESRRDCHSMLFNSILECKQLATNKLGWWTYPCAPREHDLFKEILTHKCHRCQSQ